MNTAIQNSALLQAAGLLKNLSENLSGTYGFNWLVELKKFCRKESSWQKPEGWNTWKTLIIRSYESLADFEDACTAIGVVIYGRARAILSRMAFKQVTAYQARFVLINIVDLGFSVEDEVCYSTVLKTAQRLGLKKCSLIEMMNIRLAFLEQMAQTTCCEHVLVGTDTVGDEPQLFELSCDGSGRKIGTILTKGRFDVHSQFIFKLA